MKATTLFFGFVLFTISFLDSMLLKNILILSESQTHYTMPKILKILLLHFPKHLRQMAGMPHQKSIIMLPVPGLWQIIPTAPFII